MIAPEVVKQYRELVGSAGLGDFVLDDRPWGGEFIYTDAQLTPFIAKFFPDYNGDKAALSTPKLLFMAPRQRFSWQYHHRRGEVWRVVEGPVGLINSPTNEQPEPKPLQTGEQVEMGPTIRHRLVGSESWGVVAELWRHADLANPSNEADNVRLEDDYKRAVK